MRNPIIVALDVADVAKAWRLVEELASVVGAFKVGKELFVRAGPEIVRRIRGTGASVFLDLKFHDIPNTVGRAVAAGVELDVQMMTVHAGGGRGMLEAAQRVAVEEAAKVRRVPPLILGVTVLTSLETRDLLEVGVQGGVSVQVERLARLAVGAGLRGLVCSPLEIAFLRSILPPEVELVTPGIRGAGVEVDDQKRTLSAAEALKAGASWLVIGRPIVAAPDPRVAAEAILATLGGS